MAIDVSHWDGILTVDDWKKISEAGHSIAYIKATEGLWEDGQFETNVKNAHAAGLNVGAYVYLSGATPPVKTIEFFHKVVVRGFGNITMKLPPVLDIEEQSLTPTQVILSMNTADELFKRHSMLYGSRDFIQSHVSVHELKEHDMWIAEYTSNDKPILPNGCNGYAMWQYTNDGVIPGVSGKFDLNKVSPSFASLYAVHEKE